MLCHPFWVVKLRTRPKILTPNQMYLFLNMSLKPHLTSELVQTVASFKGNESYGGNEVGLNGWTGVHALQK